MAVAANGKRNVIPRRKAKNPKTMKRILPRLASACRGRCLRSQLKSWSSRSTKSATAPSFGHCSRNVPRNRQFTGVQRAKFGSPMETCVLYLCFRALLCNYHSYFERFAFFCDQGTSNCERHFRSFHREEFNAAVAARNKAKNAQGKQTTLKAPQLTEARKKEITRALAFMVCVDREAFAIVEREVAGLPPLSV